MIKSNEEPDPSPLDYRIAIAEACGASHFRETVLNSNSNTDGAIYFRKSHLNAIANHLGLSPSTDDTMKDLRTKIRQYVSQSPHCISTSSPSNNHNPKTGHTLATDGGHTQMRLSSPHKKFSLEELIHLAEAIGTTPDVPYIETELRRLAGSSIAGPYLSKLLSASHIDPYLSINVGSTTAPLGPRGYYPYLLHAVDEVPESATERPACYRYIIDSAIGKSDFGNTETLDTAARVNADAAILADDYHDIDSTVTAVLNGLDKYETHPFDGEVIIPLQPPHGECVKKLLDAGVSTDHIFAIGGLKDCNDDQRKIKATRTVRETLGPDATIHGLGFGITDELATEIRSNPTLLDSIDYSTPAQDCIGDFENGQERLSSVAASAGATLIEDIRKVSSLVPSNNYNTTGTEIADF